MTIQPLYNRRGAYREGALQNQNSTLTQALIRKPTNDDPTTVQQAGRIPGGCVAKLEQHVDAGHDKEAAHDDPAAVAQAAGGLPAVVNGLKMQLLLLA